MRSDGKSRSVVTFNFHMEPSLKTRMQVIANIDRRSLGRLAEDAINIYVSNREESSGQGPSQQPNLG